MKLVDQKVGPVDVKLQIEAGEFQILAGIPLAVVAGPLLDKIAELIPGHFEDGLIQAAKDKLAALAAAPSA